MLQTWFAIPASLAGVTRSVWAHFDFSVISRSNWSRLTTERRECAPVASKMPPRIRWISGHSSGVPRNRWRRRKLFLSAVWREKRDSQWLSKPPLNRCKSRRLHHSTRERSERGEWCPERALDSGESKGSQNLAHVFSLAHGKPVRRALARWASQAAAGASGRMVPWASRWPRRVEGLSEPRSCLFQDADLTILK